MADRSEMAASPASQQRLIQRAGRPMATDVSVQIAATSAQVDVAQDAADACMRWFDEVDTHLSRFQPESELSRLNRVAGTWFAASELLYEAATVAVKAAQASDGLFDPTLLHQIEALGYDRDFAQIAQQEVPRTLPATPFAAVSQAAWRAIEFDRRRRRIRLPQNAGLDLGGIAKGWAADIALNRFCLPFTGALINVGGDLRARGGPALGESWSVGIRDPRYELTPPKVESAASLKHSQETHVAILNFSRGGLATSGAVRRWWLRAGKRQHHLLDPRTRRPIALWTAGDEALAAEAGSSAPLIATVTALAPTAARAEVAAKVALLRGYPQAFRAVEAAWERPIVLDASSDVDAAVALIFTFGNGEYVASANLPAYLATWGSEGISLPLTIDMPVD